jgi:hypothetical protein
MGTCGILAGAAALGVVPGASQLMTPLRQWLRPSTQQVTPTVTASVSTAAWRSFGQRSVAPRVVQSANKARVKLARSGAMGQVATSAVGTRGLVGWWAAENDANDRLGINNGTLPGGVNNPTFGPGKNGQGWVFDGSDDYVKLPENLFPFPTSGNGNRPFSFELWFKTNGSGMILGQQASQALVSPGGWVPALYVGNDGMLRSQLFWSTNDGNNQILSSGAVNDNNFHHVAITYDGTLQKLYFDGAFVGQRSHTQKSYATTYYYQLGLGYTSTWPQGNGGWFPFKGTLDEVALYNRALSFEEVRAIYEANGSGRSVANVTNTADSGAGSLRAAITQANSQPGTIITFQIPTSDSGYNATAKTYTIRPQTALPTLSGTSTLLAGTSQNNEAGDRVVLDGAQAGAAANGLTLSGTNSMVEGLSIRGFGGDGIHVTSTGSGNTFSHNLLSDNGKLGINLAGGTEDSNSVTANDNNDSDSGANGLQNFPVVDGAFFAPTTSTLKGRLSSTPNTPFLIEIFRADAADASGYGEAPTFVGSLEVLTNGSGQALWTQTLGSTNYSSKYFVMTATNLATGETSELSAARQMETVPTVTNTLDSGAGSLRAAMTFANAHRGTNIKFAIPTTDPGYTSATRTFTVALQSPLPALTMDETFIDGGSQSATTNDRVILNGAGAGAAANGFAVQSSNNTIEELEIRGFGGHGIEVNGAGNINNKFSKNLIHSNGKLGINLAGGTENANGVTANDNLDLDNGANGLQNFPVIERAFYNAGSNQTTISGRLNSSPSKQFRVEFFVSDAADASGYGEGAQYLSYDDVTTNESGTITFSHTHTGDLRGKFVSVTAHRRDVGSTSEFSASQVVTDWPNIVTNTNDSGAGSLRAAMEYANANPGTTISFDIPTAGNNYNSTTRIFTITPQSTLPAITAAGTRIDGSTQNNVTNDRVAINGSQVGGTANGLTLQSINGFVDDLDFHSWGASGVVVSGVDAVRNTLTRVTTHDNGKIGINLVGGTEDANGVTANDADDSDSGPNGLQNFPVLQGVFYNSVQTEIVVKGYLQSTPSKTFTLQLFGSNAPDASGYGEGARYLKEQSVTTNAQGRINFEVVIDEPSGYALMGKFISATARRNDSPGTSEWSQPKEVVLAGSLVTNTADTGSGSLRAAIEFANANPSTTISFNIPTSDPNYVSADGTFVIQPQTPLPTITAANTFVDGLSEYEYRFGWRNDNAQLIIIDGTRAGAAANGLTLQSTSGRIENLQVRNFGGHGVVVSGASATGNALFRNRIYSNGKLGINLVGGSEDANGVTANDAQDADSGANNLQNFPVISGVFHNPTHNHTTVYGSLNAAPNTQYTIEFFHNAGADASGYGEGQIYLHNQDLTFTTNQDGRYDFSRQITGNLLGRVFSAIARRVDNGSTSEFSASVVATAFPYIVTNTGDSGPGSLRAAMEYANTRPNTKIYFQIPTTDPNYDSTTQTYVISPLSPLPAITADKISIDGLTQSESTYGWRWPHLWIILDGTQAGAGANGLQLKGKDSEVVWMGVRNFGAHGIQVSGTSATNNSLFSNHIYNNGKLGIDLEGGSEGTNGVTANDGGDSDSGANGLQNFPILESVTYASNTTQIRGFLDGVPNKYYRIELFSGDAADASGYGEGQTFLASNWLDVLTDAQGNAPIVANISLDLRGKYITATATENHGTSWSPIFGATSEFSAAKRVSAIALVTNTADSGNGSLRAAIVQANANPGTTISFNIPTSDANYSNHTFTIKLQSALPAITAANTYFNGFSQYRYYWTSQDRNTVILDGTQAGTGVDGLVLQSAQNTVEGLIFRNFGGSGLKVSGAGAVGNRLTRNHFSTNGKLGIDLAGGTEDANGVTANDAGDADSGPNALQNFPVLDRASYSSNTGHTQVRGSLQALPNRAYDVQFFVSDAADASGYGEGAAYWGTSVVFTDSDGEASFVFSQSDNHSNKWITAISIDRVAGNTSEFGNAKRVQESSAVVVNSQDSGTGSLRAAIEFANANPGTTITFNIPNNDPGFRSVDGVNFFLISPQSTLPAITAAGTTIAASTQPNSRRIVVDGTSAGADVNGLTLQSRNARIESLTIRNFTGHGVQISGAGATGNTLTRNYIHSNGKLGINLVGGSEDANGVTANDAQDADSGPNGLVNHPLLTGAFFNGGNNVTTIQGRLEASSNSTYLVELFRSETADASGYGEGALYVGQASVTTDSAGQSAFSVDINGDLSGQFISATSTHVISGSSSEFGQAKVVQAWSNIVTNTNDSGPGSLRSAIEFANASPETTITFNIPDSDTGYEAASSAFVIKPQTALPAITATKTVFDGLSQRNFNSSTHVAIDGSLQGANANGLVLQSTLAKLSYFEIRNFSGHGIVVESAASGNDITAMSIHSNSKLGINLVGGSEDANGVTANDAGDGDSGPNGLQNFPTIAAASYNAGTNSTTISGHLDAAPNARYDLDFYVNGAADASGHGEGTQWASGIGRHRVFTDENGRATFNVTASNANYGNKFLTATATSASGDTSEFSAARLVLASSNIVVNTNDSGPGSLRAAIEFANANPGTTIIFNIPSGDANYDSTNKLFVIAPQSTLPAITAANSTFDGATQTNIVSNSRVVIDGAGAPDGTNGLTLQSTSIKIDWLAIRNFKGHGVQVSSAANGNSITRTQFHNNGKLGINLAGGTEDANSVTANDALDADNGANGLQNFPIIEKAFYNSSTQLTTVSGRLLAAPDTTYDLHFYGSNTADASGYGEGQIYLANLDKEVTTNAQGEATFTVSTSSPDLNNKQITATATHRVTGSTSEFSAAKAVTLWSNIVTNTADSGPGSLRAAIEFANANAGTTITFNINTTDPNYDSANSVYVIKPQSTLPAITGEGTFLDGWSQYNYYGGAWYKRIVIDGSNAPDGASGLALQGNGIFVQALHIRNFKGDGIAVSGTGNKLVDNLIYNNSKLGINLAGGTEDVNGVTANDALDADNGANELTNYPVIESATYRPDTAKTTIAGYLSAQPNTRYDLQFFRSDAADASGYGEGKTFIDISNTDVFTDENGRATFSHVLSSNYQGQHITATATARLTGSTSEFSAAKIVSQEGSATISSSDPGVYEGDSGTTNISFALTLSSAVNQAVTVNYVTANNTAVAPSDFTNVSGTVTFNPGETSKNVTVAINGDTLNEADETFYLNLSNPTNALLQDVRGIGTIHNDDAAASLSINDITVAEPSTGTTAATFTVTLSQAVGQAVTVNYATANDTAAAPGDFTAANGTITFDAGETSKTITVDVNADTEAESTERFYVDLSNATNAVIGDSRGIATLVSTALSVTNVSVDEGNTGQVNASFTVTLAPAVDRVVTVDYAATDGTAKVGDDFVATSGTLTFAANETSKTVVVPVKGDVLDEINENFTLALSNASGASVSSGGGIGTINDDDPAPTLSINDVTLNEGNTGTKPANFTVTLSAVSGRTVTVNYATEDGTATAPSDYESTSGTLTFAPGETSKTLPVSVKGDRTDENDETLRVKLASNTNANLADAQGDATITDDDEFPSLLINDASITEGENGTATLNFTVNLTAAASRAGSVDFATVDGSAAAPLDYESTSGTLNFAAGDTSKTVSVAVKGDMLDEANESFVVELSNPVQLFIEDGQAQGTIIDNDATPSLSSANAQANEGNSGTVDATFTVSLSAASGRNVSVRYATSNGTAASSSDYVAADGTLTFAPGEISKPITVKVNGDELNEGDETFNLTLSAPTNATLSTTEFTGTIKDDDMILSDLSVGDTTLTEGNSGTSNANFVVRLSKASGRTVTVDYATENGSATAPADYEAKSGTLSFAPGETQKTVSVAVQGDVLDESDETFKLKLTNGGNANILDGEGVASVLDNDGPTLSIADVEVNEGNSGSTDVTLTVTLSAVSPQEVSVRYNTANGTATANDDYQSTSGTLLIPANQPTGTITVPIKGDTLDEGDQAFTMNLNTPGNATISDNAATITIKDDDGAAAPTISIADVRNDEGQDGTRTFYLYANLSNNSGRTVTVNYATENGTATEPSDYVANSGTLTFTPGQNSRSIALVVRADAVDEADETLKIKLSNATNATILDGEATVTIVNDDAPSLSVQGVTITEGNSGSANAQFKVLLSGAKSQPVTVNYITQADSAISGSDYVGVSGTLTFDVGETQKIVAVEVKGDAVYERDEIFYLNITNASPSDVRISGSQGACVISNDDALPYRATVATDVNVVSVGTAVPMTGRTFEPGTDAPMPNRLVSVRVLTNNTRREYTVRSDANGNFAFTFYPLASEAGNYVIGAEHPDVAQDPNQDTFKIVGISASPNNPTWRLVPNEPLSGKINIKNLSEIPLSGLAASVVGAPANVDVQLNVPGALPASGTVELSYTATTTSTQRGSGTIQLKLTTTEGAVLTIPVNLRIEPLVPNLVANPGSLSRGMLRGAQTLVEFEVTNNGGAASGEVQVLLPPDVPWLKLASEAKIPSIEPGKSVKVMLSLTPASNLPLQLYKGAIVLSATRATLNVNYEFRAVSDAVGDMKVLVEDEYTYYSAGSPRVAGAQVTLSDPFDASVVFAGTTGEDGSINISGIKEGTYVLDVRADKHGPARKPCTIVAGITGEMKIFIPRQTVSYNWTVVPTEIEDKYKIVLESTFETNVPFPVVTVDKPFIMPLLIGNEPTQVDIVVTNHGLIAAENVSIKLPQTAGYTITPLVDNIGKIPAKTSLKIPFVLKKTAAGIQSPQRSTGPQKVEVGGGCPEEEEVEQINIHWSFPCNGDKWHDTPINLKPIGIAQAVWECVQEVRDCVTDVREWKGNLAGAPTCVIDALCTCAGLDDCACALIKLAAGALTGGAAGAASQASGLWDCICFDIPIPTPPPGPPLPGLPSIDWEIGTAGAPYGIQVGFDLPDTTGDGCGGGAAQSQAARVLRYGQMRVAGMSREEAEAALAAEQGVCARVKLRIEQEAVMTRTAFAGTLEITNGRTDSAISGLRVTIDIKDTEGNDANSKLFHRPPTLTNLNAVDGTGTLAANTTGTARYTFIPTREAAPDGPVRYRIGGTIRYIEEGQEVTVPLLPATILVMPDARLTLKYFQQRDVIGDDPFTDPVEPSEPFSLGLLALNNGKGTARNFRITSAQPKIVENEKGLLIDFVITGTQVGNNPVAPSLTANLGNIDPGKAEVARWMMTSTLQGKFVEYKATFEHSDDLGGKQTSLIDNVEIHELLHVARADRAGDDDRPDFLANDDRSDLIPDMLYMSDGSSAVVNSANNALTDGAASHNDLQVQLTANVPPGWSYLRVPDPGPGFKLLRVVRSDNKELRIGDPGNVWRTRISFSPNSASYTYENLLHLLDHNAAGAGGGTATYTLHFGINDSVAPQVLTVGPVASPQNAAINTVDVVMSEEIDLSTFTRDDVVLKRNNGANLITDAVTVTVTHVTGKTYRINGLNGLTSADGNYSLTVNGAGIEDFGNNAGINSLSTTWAKGTAAPVVVKVGPVTPKLRNSPVTTVEVEFSKAIDAATFDRDDIVLKRNDGTNLVSSAVTVTAQSETLFEIGGLGNLTSTDGDYVLTVNAEGIKDTLGTDGVGAKSTDWTKDASALTATLQEVATNPRNIVVPSLDVTFSKAINESTFTVADLSLSRNGGANLLTNAVKIEKISDTVYRISNFNWVSGDNGTYVLSVNVPGISDLAGNAGSGTASQTWTMDTIKPAAPTALTIAPDRGVSNSDNITNTSQVTLSGTLGETDLTVRIFDLTTNTELGEVTSATTSFSKAIDMSVAGTHNLRVRATDKAGNVSDETLLEVFVDTTVPTATLETVAPDPRNAAIATLDVTFSEAIDQSTLTAQSLTLTRDGGANLIGAGVSIAHVENSTYRISGLNDLTGQNGAYVLTLKAGTVTDTAGNALAEAVSESWEVQGGIAPVQISINDVSVSEPINGSTNAQFTVTLSRASTQQITVLYSTQNGTAVQPGDYTTTQGMAVFEPGETTRSISVPVRGDAEAEGNENFKVVLSEPTNATLADGEGVGTIISVEPGAVALSITPSTLREGGAAAQGTVAIAQAALEPVTVVLSSSDTNTVTVPASVVIPAGQASATFAVTPVDNLVADGDKSAVITATATGFGAGTSTVTVQDNDASGIIVTPLQGLTTTETGGSASFTVVLGSRPTANVSIALSSSNPAEGNMTPAELVFTPDNWNVSQMVTITGVNDNLADGDQPYTVVTAAAMSADATYNGRPVDDVSVVNRDDESGPVLTLTLAGTSIGEGGTLAATVTRNTPPTSAMDVNLGVTPAGSLVVPTTVTIPAGANSVAFNITASDDAVAQGTRDAMISATHGMLSSSQRLSIVDNEQPTLTLSVNPTSFSEAALPIGKAVSTGTVSRNTPSESAVTVNLNSSDNGEAKVPATVTIPAGSASANFVIMPVDDNLADGSQAVQISAAAEGFTGAQSTLTVTDNETPALTITVVPTRFAEGATGVKATITRNSEINANTPALTVNLTSSDTSEVRVPVRVNIPARTASVTVTLTIPTDSVADGPQRVTLKARATGFTEGSSAVTVLDKAPSSNLMISGQLLSNSTPAFNNAPIPEATIVLRKGTVVVDEVTTDRLGNYSFKQLAAGSYTVTPLKSGFTFAPTSSNLTLPRPSTIKGAPHAVGVNFVGTPRTSIRGTLMRRLDNGVLMPVVGGSLIAYHRDGAIYARTDKDGNYLFDRVGYTAYQIMPLMPGSYFRPRVRIASANATTPNVTGIDFLAEGSDSTAPQVTIVEPRASSFTLDARSTLNVKGTASDSGGGNVAAVTVALAKFSATTDNTPDGFWYWKNNTFITLDSPVVVEAVAKGTTSWSLLEPTMVSDLRGLPAGFYGVRATVTDGAGNITRSTWRKFRITGNIVTRDEPDTRPRSAVALSSFGARSDSANVSLSFTGVLDADSATEAANYEVTVNGQLVVIEAISLSNGGRGVVIGLPEGSLKSGDRVVVKWRNVLDGQNRVVEGSAGPITVQ